MISIFYLCKENNIVFLSKVKKRRTSLSRIKQRQIVHSNIIPIFIKMPLKDWFLLLTLH